MLAIAFVAVAMSVGTASLLWLSGHTVLAVVAAPLAGSAGALAAALAIAHLAPSGASIRSRSAETRAAIGAGLRKMYGGLVQEPLPEPLARIAARLEKR